MFQRQISDEPLKLVGFNNLTKALSFNLYDFCGARTPEEKEAYTKYIAQKFNAKKITGILKGICDIIEARVISISDQDYDPWGASSLVLMSDLKGSGVDEVAPKSSKAMHLDKSHICAHTYPDFLKTQLPDGKEATICSFRIDIDIATCGEISPLKALNYMFENLESDVVVIDYVVRGFTRDENGRRVYLDHEVRSIQDYIDPKILKDYACVDLALQAENIWQTKMMRTRLDERTYFLDPYQADDPQTKNLLELIKREMKGLLLKWPE